MPKKATKAPQAHGPPHGPEYRPSEKRLKRKIWRDVLKRLTQKNPPEFTAVDIMGDFELSYPGAAQLLRRLQSWGHIRLIAFDPPAGGGAGRRRKVYEVTQHGKNAAAYVKKALGG